LTDDLREVIMRPVDTAAIQSEIEERNREKREIDARIEEIEDLKARLPELEERKRSIEGRIEEKEEIVDEKEREVDRFEADVEVSKERKRKRERALDELQTVRSDLETVRRRIESERESISALEAEYESVEVEYEAFEAPGTDSDTLDSEISVLRERKRSVESKISRLRQIIQFNSDLQEGEMDLLDSLTAPETGDCAVTERLLDDSGTVCWTCGSAVDPDRIGAMLDQLRSMHEGMVEERNSLSDRIDELKRQRDEINRKRREERIYKSNLDDLSTEIQHRKDQLEELLDERDDLETVVEEHERRVNEFGKSEQEELLEIQKDLTNHEFELSSLQGELADVVDEIGSLECEIDKEEELRARHENVESEIASLRTRIEDLEREAVDSFNEHIGKLLDILDYDNIQRIWIERVQKTVRNGRQKEEQSIFDMHIVRETSEGKSYEDTIAHLSESEREFTGLVFALAGYLVHDVHERLPFILLDSLEAMDSDRIAALVEYFSRYADYLFVALLPEDSERLPERCHRITEI
jgi:chromosome segregation ATPase